MNFLQHNGDYNSNKENYNVAVHSIKTCHKNGNKASLVCNKTIGLFFAYSNNFFDQVIVTVHDKSEALLCTNTSNTSD